MADFRKWIYALAGVALLAGFTVPASAQGPQFQCIANAGSPPIVRAEGYTELVGDLTLNCTGGTSTLAGQAVPPVNITIFLNTNITSRLLTGNFDEALLIVDDPHTSVNANQILNCGAAGAPDNVGGIGFGRCNITSDGNSADTYNGTAGHPNVFQAQLGTPQNAGISNSITFLGVPIDPPGTQQAVRTFRFTNIRANVNQFGVSSASGFITQNVEAQISISGNTSMQINNPQQILAFVQKGLISSVGNTNFSYLQCNTVTGDTSTSFKFTEGFASSWKPKNISNVISTAAGGVGNGASTGTYWQYVPGQHNYPTADLNQNVPGALYNTESGFEFPATNDPTPNPPAGTGTTALTTSTTPFADANTGISGAGIADSGTRLALQFSSIPTGVTVSVPLVIQLVNTVGTNSGVAVLVNTDANGAGAYSPATSGAVSANSLLVYEIVDADPFSIESLTVPFTVSYTPNLAQNLPQVGSAAQVSGSFAPFYPATAGVPAHFPGQPGGLPIPRFQPGNAPVNLFSISKCACDMLFPFVANGSGYDTGIAIANTSLDNLGLTGNSLAAPQNGTVTFWFYGTNAPANSATSPVVQNGTVQTYTLSGGFTGATGSNTGAAPGFEGYIIAQAQFQYCHSFVFIGAFGAGPYSPGISEGYLGLILDNKSLNCVGNGGLCRTVQNAEVLGN